MTIRFAPYSRRCKLADMISAELMLLGIVERLGIRLGFGDATVDDICRRYGLSPELFLMICNVYSFDGYMPHVEELHRDDLPHLVAYLRASHRYYTEVCFPRLHEHIHAMVASLDVTNRRVIDRFFDDYQAEVDNHFAYEEETVFPYIESLISGGARVDGYNIDQFGHNHGNIEDKLNDIKNIVLKYLPESSAVAERHAVLEDIFRIEKDLDRHTEIENRILIPLVAKLEKDE
ncbi:MAG: hemerythrin domain-containing protein [Rikenellaceae bacterium]|nr:hemerythrin domain-containing protein [Rikenellaceae bacterium]